MHSILKKTFFLLFVVPAVMEASARQTEDSITTVVIKAIGGLQYDLVRFKVKPGATVRIILTNEDDMSHNLVLTMPGARAAVVNAALKLGVSGVKMDYIPQVAKVLWHIKLLSPGETKSITFRSPKKGGVYPYVCTYPGHGFVMFGAMYVTDKMLPDIKNDPNIPPGNRTTAISSGNGNYKDHSKQISSVHHPYKTSPPYLYRTFMPDAGPAAIAVSLPDSISYCWDAGSCRLRYVWQGDFLDNSDVWKGHKDAYAKVSGAIFFRDKTLFPLHVDNPDTIPSVKFKGYRLLNRYPEFHYTMDEMEVFELIKSKADGTGLIRTFRIPQNNKTIWFTFNYGDGMSYSASSGEWINGKLKLSAEQAREFTIIMTKEKL